MKILFVDMQYDYGVEARGANIIGQDGFKKSFEALGHEVVLFYYDSYLQNITLLQNDLIRFAEEVQPDLIFFSLYRDQFSYETLDVLKSKFVTVNWFGDDQWRFDNFTARYASHFSWCVTTDKFAIPKYKSLGQSNVIYSQWAAINAHEIPKFEGYKYDVTFVGGFHPYRKWFIDFLRNRGVRIEAFGNGWANGPLSGPQMNKVFASSKISLNISNSNSFDIRYLLSHWKTMPLLFKSAKNFSQMKARNFEIPFFGGFQLSDYVPTIEDYFDIGNEVICYKDVDEAYILIKHYLTNDIERESIKELGHKRAISSHGYIHRIKSVLEQMQ